MRFFENVADIFDASLNNPRQNIFSAIPNSDYKIWEPWLDYQQHGRWLNDYNATTGEIKETNSNALLNPKLAEPITDGEMRIVWGNFSTGPKFLGVFQYQASRSTVAGIRIYKRV